jgi:uncharacterized protein
MSKLNYDQLVQEALRGVIVQILKHIEDNGMQKQECVRLTFVPTVKGVVCPSDLMKEYANGLCVEFQEDKYENLKVGHDRLSVDLYIGDVTEHFVIPFKAIANIVDPESQFGLEFDVQAAIGAVLPENVVCLDSFRRNKS